MIKKVLCILLHGFAKHALLNVFLQLENVSKCCPTGKDRQNIVEAPGKALTCQVEALPIFSSVFCSFLIRLKPPYTEILLGNFTGSGKTIRLKLQSVDKNRRSYFTILAWLNNPRLNFNHHANRFVHVGVSVILTAAVLSGLWNILVLCLKKQK